MDTYELLDRSPGLRRVLLVWNVVCAAAAGSCVAGSIVLLVADSSSDSLVDVSGPFAGVAFLLACLVGLWWAGRAAFLLLWKAVRLRGGRDLAP